MTISKRILGNILETENRHIAFAVNEEGANDAGFAGMVSSQYWPELAYIGNSKLGSVLSLNTRDKVFHAMVCHSLGKNGWRDTPRHLTQCFNKLLAPIEEPISCVYMGSGLIGRMMGADLQAITIAIDLHPRIIHLYSIMNYPGFEPI